MSTKKRNREELQFLRDEALQAYLNREDFQYDLNGDALYRQYKDRYVELGRNAMQDTMGQAAALTGGYGSSYAQNVGQQAYNSYLQQLGDVVPELYKLAYDRYRDRGDRLYQTYQSWAQLEQEAADREQQDRDYALELQKQQDANTRFLLELDSRSDGGNDKKPDGDSDGEPLGDYYAWLAYHQGSGKRPDSNDPTVVTQYDNQDVSTGHVLLMQRILSQPETGMWTLQDQNRAGGMDANTAWLAYQKGQLQNRNSRGLGGTGLSVDKIKKMERTLGLTEDGVWGQADMEAVGGLTDRTAWEAYLRGLLKLRQ